MKILYVEDQPLNAALMTSLLKDGLGCEVHLATNVFEAIRILETEFDIGLIITDLHLPGSSGLVLLQQIKANPGWKRIPTIVCTGDTNKETVINVARLGVKHFLCKPPNKAALRTKLKQAITESPVPPSKRLEILLELDIELDSYEALQSNAKVVLKEIVDEVLPDVDEYGRDDVGLQMWPEIWDPDGTKRAAKAKLEAFRQASASQRAAKNAL